MNLEMLPYLLISLIYVIGLPVAVVVLLVRTAAMQRELRAVEARLGASPARPAPEPTPDAEAESVEPAGEPDAEIEPQPAPETDDAAAAPEPILATSARGEAPRRDFEAQLAGGWFVWIAAAALILAGVFLVREAIQQGWLTPAMRVLGGGLLGVVLLGAAEWLRRNDPSVSERAFHAPAALAVGGVSALFAAILAARHLYGLLGPELGFLLMAASAALAMALAWLHGPVLAGAGLLGGYLTPALVGGEPQGPAWLFAYVLALSVACYGVERLKQWGWVAWSATLAALLWGLALISGFADGATATETAVSVAIFAPILAAAAVIAPGYGWPLESDEPAPALASYALGRSASTPALIGLAGVAVGAALLLAATLATDRTLIGCAGFAALLGFAMIALRRVRALDEAAAIALLAACLALLLGGGGFGSWTPRPEIDHGGFTPLLFAAGLLIALTLGGAEWRSRQPRRRLYWAVIGGFGAAALFFSLYLGRWDMLAPAEWAIGALAVAAAQTVQASRAVRAQGDAHGDASVYALAAFATIAGGAGILFAGAPLNLALAALALAAALVDRRLDSPALALATSVAAALLGVRLLIWPGVEAALMMTAWELALAYPPAALACAAAATIYARAPLDAGPRRAARVIAESAAMVFLAAWLSLLARRAFMDDGGAEPHVAELGLHLSIWGLAALAQFYRALLGGRLRRLRLGLAALAGALAFANLIALFTIGNPLETGAHVGAWPIFDAIGFAYLGAAALFAVGSLMAQREAWPGLTLGLALIAGGAALGWAMIELRRLWHGPVLSSATVFDGELYSYTLALLVISVGVTLLGAWRDWAAARRVGLGLAALAILKAFLIDMAGLDGLWLAGSFLALGLALVGLAWLYRRLEKASAAETP